MIRDEQTTYFLDCAVQLGHIGADTSLWMSSLVENPDDVLREASSQAYRMMSQQNHMASLIQTGALIEQAYMSWRREGNRNLEFSMSSLLHAPSLFEEIVGTCSNYLMDNNIETMETAFPLLDGQYQILDSMSVLRNSVIRANEDLGSADKEKMDRVKQKLLALNSTLHQAHVRNHISHFTNNDYSSSARFKLKWRKMQQVTRKAIRRSAEVLSSVAGEKTTRMFLTDGKITVEGKNCLYEIRRGSNLAHGGAGPGKLLILDKGNPSVVLCDMCILSPGVPMMDHVASLILHIRSGLEHEILKVGNIGGINKLAYDQDWLLPYLPAKRNRSLDHVPLVMDGSQTGLSPFNIPQRNLEEVKQIRSYVGHWVFERTIANWSDLVVSARPEEGTHGLYNCNILLPNEPDYEQGLLQVVDAYCYAPVQETGFERVIEQYDEDSNLEPRLLGF